MSANPLFYQSVIPLNRETHREMAIVDSEERYGFARGTHVIPAVVDEFAAALSHLPIVFAPSSPHPSPVFLVGVRPAQNLFIDHAGRWMGNYLPAFVRRYPFMRGTINGGDPITCVDEKSDLWGASSGVRLFDADGGETPFLRNRIELVDQYYVSARKTERFVALIAELGLLRQVTIETNVGKEASSVIHGFMTIDEEKLKQLPDQDFVRLRADGFLGAIYAHLFSLRSLDVLRRMIVEAPDRAGSSGEPEFAADMQGPTGSRKSAKRGG
ncbi:SapC family protein [Burkholderiales bacterium GJ-E10]|nr:SapC family protein [Burkholderiales bacterium GJ-E10]